MATVWRRIIVVLAALDIGACVPPPASQMPSPQAAEVRLRATTEGCVAIAAEGRFSHKRRFEDVTTGSFTLLAAPNGHIRLDIHQPPLRTIGTFTSNGDTFAWMDWRERRVYVGPAAPCAARARRDAVESLAHMPVAPHVLADLVRGQAPLEAGTHETLAWDRWGFYLLGQHTPQGSTGFELGIPPGDRDKFWQRQRLRVLRVRALAAGETTYDARLAGHARAAMSEGFAAMDDERAVPPSGPYCDAELPRTVTIDVPSRSETWTVAYEKVKWNPPLVEGAFEVQKGGADRLVTLRCD